jgi:hypothetical protein
MKKWGEYYKECKKLYGNNNKSIYDLTIQNNIDKKLKLDKKYFNLIDEINLKLDKCFQDKLYTHNSNAFFVNDCFLFENEFSNLIEIYLRDYLQNQIFGCFIHCDHVTLYKTPTSSETNTKSATNSWLWHMDNSPQEQIKVMIYLNDVGPKNGPFEVLRNEKTNEGLKITPSRIDHTNWKGKKDPWTFKYKDNTWNSTRIPDNLFGLFKKDGYIPHKIIGNKGHISIFDNNIIHRGTIPPESHRYAVVFQFKPINKNLPKVFSKSITGNGTHHPVFTKDPEFMWDSNKK